MLLFPFFVEISMNIGMMQGMMERLPSLDDNYGTFTFVILCSQGLTMRQIRFRFDGQPINETDTPAQVSFETIGSLICLF